MQQPAKTLLRSWRDTIRHKTFPADEFAAAVHPCRDHEPSERQANGARADARIDARGRDGGVREELAAGADVMTNNDDVHFPALVWAVIFTILLVAAVAIFTLVLTR